MWYVREDHQWTWLQTILHYVCVHDDYTTYHRVSSDQLMLCVYRTVMRHCVHHRDTCAISVAKNCMHRIIIDAWSVAMWIYVYRARTDGVRMRNIKRRMPCNYKRKPTHPPTLLCHICMTRWPCLLLCIVAPAMTLCAQHLAAVVAHHRGRQQQQHRRHCHRRRISVISVASAVYSRVTIGDVPYVPTPICVDRVAMHSVRIPVIVAIMRYVPCNASMLQWIRDHCIFYFNVPYWHYCNVSDWLSTKCNRNSTVNQKLLLKEQSFNVPLLTNFA